MAGGLILVLGRKGKAPEIDRGIGSGIHGGKIIIRGSVTDQNLGVGAKKNDLKEEERGEIAPLIEKFAGFFGLDPAPLLHDRYYVITPASARPFASKYTWEV
jgi:glutamate synthase domain-containing protein 3